MKKQRTITRIWRGSGDGQNEACVEWHETEKGSLLDRSEHDRTRPPTTEFHAAFDALGPFIAASYSVHNSRTSAKVRAREFKLEQREDELLVLLHGQMAAEGFASPVHMHVPKQTAEGKLAGAIAELVEQAGRFIDGERGQADLFDEDQEEGEHDPDAAE